MPRPPGFALLSRWVVRTRSLIRGLRHRGEVEAEMSEEFHHHIELRTEDLARGGLPWKQALRRAHLEFGHVEAHKERARAARGLRLFDRIGFSWIDVKLGLRMLVKYPGLTLVAGFALAIGIPAGMAPLHVSNAIEAPLPEDREDRVRVLRFRDPTSERVEAPVVRDLERWREELASFSILGAFRTTSHVVSDGGGAAPVAGAQVTASTFAILGTPPLLGRTLDASDEAVGAPDVVVIGYDLWRSLFGADPDVVGRSVRLGSVPHTVVGVMPEGFLFPIRQQVWTPLPREGTGAPGRAPGVRVFGRLAEGVSAQEAAAELAAAGMWPTEHEPDARSRLRAEVVPFGIGFTGLPPGGMETQPDFYLFQGLALLLLLVTCANVAMLVFARTATRFRELAVRTALGAGRARIVSQLFAETLVLALGATGVGIVSIGWILGQARALALARGLNIPYWLTVQVTSEAVGWALLLAVLSATVAGVVPALKFTGKGIHQSIQKAGAARSAVRFGSVTGALIVADVAVAVAVMGISVAVASRLWDQQTVRELTGVAAEEFLAVEVRLPLTLGLTDVGFDRELSKRRLAATQRALVERLEAEPGVVSVAAASALPRMNQTFRRVEIEGFESVEASGGQYVATARVYVDFFHALEQPILSGRGFDRGDVERDVVPVVVNAAFTDRLLAGESPLGRRLRFVAPDAEGAEPWREIVGVVGHLGLDIVNPQEGVYVLARPGEINPLQLAIHLGARPETFVARLRDVASEVAPGAALGEPVVLDRVFQGDWYLVNAVAGGLVLLVLILVALAASGLYAILSFSISERTREIGLRAALGAPRPTLVLTILRRSLTQIVVGALIGVPFAARVLYELRRSAGRDSAGLAILAALGIGVAVVGTIALLSCLAPVRRMLGIEPAGALRAEG